MVTTRRGLKSECRLAKEYTQSGRVAWRYREITARLRLRENPRGVSHQKMLDTVIAFDVMEPDVVQFLYSRRSE
jgi:hypothetical protein